MGDNMTKEEIENKMKELKSQGYDLLAYKNQIDIQLNQNSQQLQSLATLLKSIEDKKDA